MAPAAAAAPAVAAAASRIGTAVSALARKYGPDVVQAVNSKLAQATSGKVADISAAPAYIGNDPRRARVVVEGVARAGVSMDDVLPAAWTANSPVYLQIRQSGEAILNQMRAKNQAGSDTTLGTNVADIAADMIRKRRVQTALRVYGDKESYFLCHPSGGIPEADFIWYGQLFGRR